MNKLHTGGPQILGAMVKKCSHLGNLVPGISAPLPCRDFKNLDLELWMVNNLMYEGGLKSWPNNEKMNL